MSTLVLCRGLDVGALAGVKIEPLDDVAVSDTYLAALRFWGHEVQGGWAAITELEGRTWDDHIDDCLGRAPLGRENLVGALRDLAEHCREVAIWYAGFHDDLPVTASPESFVALVEELLSSGDDEPAARMIRL